MTIQQLKLMKILVECKSISKAAQRCFLSQSSLTRQIQAMEKETGILLFERSHRGIKPTQAGRVFCEEIIPVLEQYEKALRLAGQAHFAAELSDIRIGSYYYLMSFIAPACHYCHDRNAAIDFNFISCRLCDTLDYLKNGKIDIGICVDFLEALPPCLYAVPVALANNLCKIPQGHPLFEKNQISLHDLDHQTILLPDRQIKNVSRIQECIMQSGLDIQIQYFETPDQAESIGLAKKIVTFISPPFVPSNYYHHAVISGLPVPTLSILTRKEEQKKYEHVVRMLTEYFQRSLAQFPGLLPLPDMPLNPQS